MWLFIDCKWNKTTFHFIIIDTGKICYSYVKISDPVKSSITQQLCSDVTVKIPFVVVQSLSHVRLFVTSWTAACQAPLFSTVSWSSLKFTSIELVMLSNHLTLCRPSLLLPSLFPSIVVLSNESALRINWPKYWGLIILCEQLNINNSPQFCL